MAAGGPPGSFVADLDLTPILTTFGGVTRDTVPSDPCDPRMRVAVLLYAYAVSEPASRQIARETPARTREVPHGALALEQPALYVTEHCTKKRR